MPRAERLRLVLFDCDGTLVDSQHTITAAMGSAFAAHDLSPPPRKEVRQVVGLSLGEAIGRLLPNGVSADLASLVEAYKGAFQALRLEASRRDPLFAGARETLAELDASGYLLGVCTGKSRRGLDAVLAEHELAHHFVTMQTADRHPGKPHPGMLEAALEETSVDVADTVLIGDTTYDIEMAQNAGVDAIGVAWGYHETEALSAAGARRIVHSFYDLTAIVADLLGDR